MQLLQHIPGNHKVNFYALDQYGKLHSYLKTEAITNNTLQK